MSRLYRLVLVAVVIALLSLAQDLPSIPQPTGQHSVGRTSFHWVDPTRPEPATAAVDDKREILVLVWYPATVRSPARSTAPYMPDVERLASSAAASSFSNLFGPSWPAIVSNKLLSHSFENAAVIPGAKLPVLVFSPGGGVPAVAYTTQIEDLASHGYVVIGIEHTYDSLAVAFPDGRVVVDANDFLDKLRRQSGSPEVLEKTLTDMRAADISFVIRKLRELQTEKASILPHLDLARIGVFGHSRGGRAAARACQIEGQIKACLNQDGSWMWQPFWLDERDRSMTQPFMMLDHLDPDLPDDVYKKMGTTREQYQRRRSDRQAEARDKIYSTIAGGSYHVTIRTPGISHNSFLDTRQLGRPDAGNINGWPREVQAATPNATILNTIASLTRAFFDRHLSGLPASINSRSNVEIRTYGRAAQ